MRRSHPSSLDQKGLSGISFDVCSIASTETASTVAGRGRGRGLRNRRGGGPVSEDDDSTSIGLYSDPFSSMFSPTAYSSGSTGLLGSRKVNQSSSKGMPPPDARRSHGALIGSKQGTHARAVSAHSGHGVQSVRVEISPTGSPNSPIPPSVTANIKAPAINAFRRCLMVRGGNGSGSGNSGARIPSPPPQNGPSGNSLFYFEGPSNHGQSAGHFPQVEVTVNGDSLEVAVDMDNCSNEVYYDQNNEELTCVEETHIFLFDNDPDDDMAMTVSSSSSKGHTVGKERSSRKALACKAAAPYARGAGRNDSYQLDGGEALALASRKQRRACRSRYDIDEGEENCDDGAAIYYVQVGHSALTPRDCPDGVAVPQMPLLPSSIATSVVDQELAVLEELML